MRLICVYQHAPTAGAPGFYRHRRYFAELVNRGWGVDLVSCPVDYLTGRTPARYARRPYLRETLDGVVHHWTWGVSNVHASRLRRTLNYITFSATSTVRGLTLPTPDLVWASSPPLPIGVVGMLLARRFRRPWILEIRDLWPESAASVGWLDRSSTTYRVLERLAHGFTSRADAVLVPTPGLVEGARAHGARTVDVITGTIVERAVSDERRRAVRAELGAADGTCLFVYLGAIGVANGIDAVLDAAKDLSDEPGVGFVLGGDGSDRARLDRRVADERIANVRFLGPVPPARVAEVLAAGDVCLHTLRNDPVFHAALPNKVLDYLGAHRPFVTTVEGLPRRVAEESGGGFALPGPSLTAELRRWVRMAPEERAARGEQGFAYGSERFRLSNVVDELEALLRRTARVRVVSPAS